MKKVFKTFIVVLLLSGCAPRMITPYYKDLEPTYDSVYKIKAPLVIAVQDQRPYVLSGDKNEFFYGLSRSLYGIPYSQYGSITASNDVLTYVYLLLNNDNVTSAIQQHPIDIRANGEQEALRISKGRGLLFLQIYEWKTDVYLEASGKMYYDIRASVFDKNGNVRASKTVKGVDRIINPDPEEKTKSVSSGIEEDNTSEAQHMNVRWFQKAKSDALGKILLDQEIINAINGVEVDQINHSEEVKSTEVKPTETKLHPSKEDRKSGCTTDQILMMKNSQMSDQQIKAACEEP